MVIGRVRTYTAGSLRLTSSMIEFRYVRAIMHLSAYAVGLLLTSSALAQTCYQYSNNVAVLGWSDTPEEACAAFWPHLQANHPESEFRRKRTLVINYSACIANQYMYGVHSGQVTFFHTTRVRPTGCPVSDGQKNNGPQHCVGNPVNAANGNKYESQTDYAQASLSLHRSYNHFGFGSGALGVKWDAKYFTTITQGVIGPNNVLNSVLATRSDGRRFVFHSAGAAWQADADVQDSLIELKDTAGNRTGWKYLVAEDDSSETYDSEGRLIEIRARTGMIHTLSYSTTSTSTSIAPRPGLLLAVRTSFGHQLSFVYDSRGRIKRMTDPGGGMYQFAYDTNNNLTNVTFPDSSSRAYVYNEPAYTSGTNLPSALTGVIDENNTRFSTFSYDAQGRAISTEHSAGVEKFEITYGANSTSAVRDPFGTIRAHSFEVRHGAFKLTGIDQPCATGCGSDASKVRSYDANGNLSSQADFNDNITNFSYDLAKNLETSRTEAYGSPSARTITTQWHSVYRLPIQIDELHRRTIYTHDANGNVLTRTVLDTGTNESRTWTYTYNGFGQVLTADGPRTDVSDVTTYTYYDCSTGYECGQVHTIENALGHVTTYSTYNAHGQPLIITDPNGVLSALTYDTRQRLKSRTIGTEITSFDYWPTGLLKKATLPDSSYIEYTYDAAHRLTDISDAEGNRIHYTLDAMGNRTAEEVFDPLNALTQMRTRVFNTLNRLHKEIGAAGGPSVTTTFGYDDNGNRTDIDAPLARSTDQSYDELNRLTQITDAMSGVTKYGYNALDQLTSVTDPRNKVTSYQYNALGDLQQQLSPDTGTTISTYDSAGNLETRTDARGKIGTYAYDALNRVTGVTYADQTIGYVYDAGANQKGRLTQVTDGSGSTSWTYDPQGRVLSRQQAMGSVTKTIGYGYDSAGRLETLTLPSGNTIGYAYTNGKITSLTLNGSTTLLSNVIYQPFGPTTGWTWGNNTFAVREYDLDGKITHLDSAGMKTYSYDDAFRIIGIIDVTDPSFSQSFGYDLLDRLTSANGTNLSQGWAYDGNGNRLTESGGAPSTYTVSSTSNRTNSIAGSLTRTYSYDAAGNALSDGTATYTYNDAGRMMSATSNGTTATYSLNALGQRVRKTVSGASAYFVYDEAGHLAGEYDGSGNLIQETIWFGETPVAVLKLSGSTTSVFYVHADHLNTPRRITRASDNMIVWRWDSDPFGTIAASEDPDADTKAFVYNFRFAGQYYDSESGLHYNYYRDYDPITGRYIESDPLGLLGGLNSYLYAEATPVRSVDPLGLKTCGSGWNEPFVPDNPRSFPFSDCCQRHDECYGTCGATREVCDEGFLYCMVKACTKYSAKIIILDCSRWAMLYYRAVDRRGQDAYDRAQREACNGCTRR